jgi:ketosteroid isomerase-like protein
MTTPPEEAVLAANRGFYAAMKARDASAMERLWAKTSSVACVHPGWDVLHGRDPVLASFRVILGSAQAPDIQPSDETVLLLGDTAMVICTEHIGDSELVATNVFFFEEGAWKMVHHHASPPASEWPSRVVRTSKLN